MSRNRLVLALVALVALVPTGLFLNYVLPKHEVVRIVGTEVRRVDLDGKPVQGGDRPGVTRDVFLIFTEDVESKAPHVYRNEDTGWGFPWYFKFDTTDLQAVAQSIANDRGLAIVKSYGWRINLFSTFPNATKITRTDTADVTIIPWFNIIFLTILAVVAFLIWRGVRRFRRRPKSVL